MKFGYECEGRLKGLFTLFLQASELYNFATGVPIDRMSATDAEDFARVKHVYISDHGGDVWPNNPSLNLWFNDETPVTIEVTAIPKNRHAYPINVSFMLTVEHTKAFWGATATDQIKFSEGHGKRVLACTIETMVETHPEDFARDRKLVLKAPPKEKKLSKAVVISKQPAPKPKPTAAKKATPVISPTVTAKFAARPTSSTKPMPRVY